jgi:hypothetical protein
LPKATALSREECLIAALEQRVVIGDMLNGKLKAHCEMFYRTSRLVCQSAFAGTMVCGGVGWLVTLVVAFANGWDASSMWIASVVSGACCALVFIAFKIA